MQLSIQIGANLQSFLLLERERLGFSQKAAFEKVGVNKATYYRWEQGSPIPSDKLALLSELGFDIQFVVKGKRQGIDEKSLIYCIEKLEEALIETGRHLNAEQKAKFIAYIYEDHVAGAADITPEKIVRNLRLVG
jgi:transcriptional regulator with XRE-family HTH domain